MKKILKNLLTHQSGTRLFVGLLTVVVLSAFVVWPAFADEMVDDSIEIVSEEEMEQAEQEDITPSPTPGEEPKEEVEVVTESEAQTEAETGSDEVQPTAEVKEEEQPAPESVTQKEEDLDVQATESESTEGSVQPETTEQPEVSGDEDVTPVPEQQAGASPDSSEAPSGVVREVTKTKKKRNAALVAPVLTTTAHEQDATWNYLSPQNNVNQLSVQLDTSNYDSDFELTYEWYRDSDLVQSGGPTKSTYTIPENQKVKANEAAYTYSCKVTYSYNGSSESTTLVVADITIKKILPDLSDFTIEDIPSTLDYTGTEYVFDIESKRDGMGDAQIIAQQGGFTTPLTDEGTYELLVKVEEGTNYKKPPSPLRILDANGNNKTVQITKAQTPTNAYELSGTKGKSVGGVQWYTSEVTLTPPSGYTVKKSGATSFSDTITYNESDNATETKKIILKNASGGLTGEITLAEKFYIDQIAPSVSFTYNGESSPSKYYFQENITVAAVPLDNVTSADKIECYMASSTEENPATLNWKKTKTLTVADSSYKVYARVIDEAGNEFTKTSEGIVVDLVPPKITCGADNDDVKEQYIAKKRSFTVTDDNLDSVSYTLSDDTTNVAVADNTASFDLVSPDTDGAEYEYTIKAVDKAGRTTVKTVKMINPNLDVQIGTVEIKSAGINPVYGYEAAACAVPLTLVKGTGYNGTGDPVVTKVTPVLAENEELYFEYSNGNMVPVSGLDHGTYNNTFLVDYNVGANTESSTTFTCSMTVDRKTVTVSYVPQSTTAYYHTVPNFERSAYKFDGFLDSDIEGKSVDEYWDELGIDADMEYFDTTYTSIQANGITTDLLVNKTIRPNVKDTTNYTFDPKTCVLAANPETGVLDESTALKVKRRELEGLQISGTLGENGWFTSDVTAQLLPNYSICITDDTEEQSAIEYTFVPNYQENYTEEGDNGKISYYIKAADGEISKLMTQEFKIDKTEPTDCKVIVADNIYQILNAITFGKYFNERKTVTIEGTEDVSVVDETRDGAKIQYYLGDRSLSDSEVQAITDWTDYTEPFMLRPEEFEKVAVYAKISNDAGLTKYVSSEGLVFDNKCPVIEPEGWLSKSEDEKKNSIECSADELTVTVTDSNLKSAVLYEGTNTTGEGTDILDAEQGKGVWSVSTENWSDGQSKTYTIIAIDEAQNLTRKTIILTKPVFEISADNITLTDMVYGYDTAPTAVVRWKNTVAANAEATLSDVTVSDTTNFGVVKQENGEFVISAKTGLNAGKYTTNVTLEYNHGKKSVSRCTFVVEKAKLEATYLGQSVYYYMEPVFDSDTVQVRGFKNQENENTASGYEAPTVSYEGKATETCVLTPSGGKADNYDFEYVSGVLTVTKRKAQLGENGQYQINGKLSETLWYVSDITIQPTEGYKIALDEDKKTVQDNIVLTQDTDDGKQAFYLMNEKTGELYEKTNFSYKKDVVAPVIEGVSDGQTYVVNSQNVTIHDDYLASVTVNGEAQEVTNGKSTFTLVSDKETSLYVIVASDRAGNVKEASVVLKQPSEAADSGSNTGTPITSDTGSVKKKVQIVEGAPKTTISTSTADMAAAALSTAEQNAVNNGSDANIELKVRSIDGSVSQADKEAIIASLGDYTVGQYLDITVWKTVGSGTAKKVTDLNKKIAVTITIPENLRNSKSSRKRSFAVFRVHDGKVAKLSDNDSVTNTVTISTDKFSTYALAYRDTVVGSTATQAKAKKSSSSDSSVGSGGSSGSSKKTSSSATTSSGNLKTGSVKTTTSSGGGSSSGSSGYFYTGSPKTGDTAPIVPVAIVLAVALAGIIVSIVLIRKKSSEE